MDIKVDEDLGLPVIIPVGKTRQGEGGAGQERKNQVRLCQSTIVTSCQAFHLEWKIFVSKRHAFIRIH